MKKIPKTKEMFSLDLLGIDINQTNNGIFLDLRDVLLLIGIDADIDAFFTKMVQKNHLVKNVDYIQINVFQKTDEYGNIHTKVKPYINIICLYRLLSINNNKKTKKLCYALYETINAGLMHAYTTEYNHMTLKDL